MPLSRRLSPWIWSSREFRASSRMRKLANLCDSWAGCPEFRSARRWLATFAAGRVARLFWPDPFRNRMANVLSVSKLRVAAPATCGRVGSAGFRGTRLLLICGRNLQNCGEKRLTCSQDPHFTGEMIVSRGFKEAFFLQQGLYASDDLAACTLGYGTLEPGDARLMYKLLRNLLNG